MRPFRTAFLILGFFLPLVIQAEPFGTTDVTVYDTDFLPVPEGPPQDAPGAPVAPDWVALVSDQEQTPWVIPPIPLPELPS